MRPLVHEVPKGEAAVQSSLTFVYVEHTNHVPRISAVGRIVAKHVGHAAIAG